MIEIRNLTKRYGKAVVLDSFNLSMGGAEAVALWGPNGAGKTTVVLCVLGFLSYAGEVSVLGYDARRDGKTVRSHVGYVPQQPGFYDDLTVAETLGFSAALRRLPRARRDEVIDLVDLGAHATKPVGALSGGLRQRLALATALLPDPELLLLDEPTSNLDAASREATIRLLDSLRGPNRALVITSHHLEEVSMLVDRVVVLDEGRIVDECAPSQLSERLGLRAWLHLVLDPSEVEEARRVLEQHGYASQLNGHGVLVDLAPVDKARAIAAVERAGITIRELEVWR